MPERTSLAWRQMASALLDQLCGQKARHCATYEAAASIALLQLLPGCLLPVS